MAAKTLCILTEADVLYVDWNHQQYRAKLQQLWVLKDVEVQGWGEELEGNYYFYVNLIFVIRLHDQISVNRQSAWGQLEYSQGTRHDEQLAGLKRISYRKTTSTEPSHRLRHGWTDDCNFAVAFSLPTRMIFAERMPIRRCHLGAANTKVMCIQRSVL